MQDAYVPRCAPQVHGAARTAIELPPGGGAGDELATDNPLVFPEDGDGSQGHFTGAGGYGHGLSGHCSVRAGLQYPSAATERMVNPQLSGLPPFLTEHGGLNSGMMMARTAAALVSENKILASPAVVDSIPTSGNQEDHVSIDDSGAQGKADRCECRERSLH